MPVPEGSMILKIQMMDLGGDGWNENIFGFKQGNEYVGIFGDTFTEGSQMNTSLSIPINILTQIVVYQLGTSPS